MTYKKEIPLYRGRYKGREIYAVDGTDSIIPYIGNNISVGWITFYIHPLTKKKIVVSEFRMNETTEPKIKNFPVYQGYTGFSDKKNSNDGKEYLAIFSHVEPYKNEYANKDESPYYIHNSNDIIDYISIELPISEGWLKLNDGKFMAPSLFYGKYQPNLLIINTIPEMEWDNNITPANFNLAKGDLSCIRGNFFVTKKGTKAFEINKEGDHLLLRDSWGGAFNSYRGETLPKEIYYKKASSNGGGTGYDYAIIQKNWKYQPNVEDF